MDEARGQKKKIDALTSVRFFAAFYVLFYHVQILAPIYKYELPAWLTFSLIGDHGVSFFFVLSGFILFYNYQGSPLPLARFFRTRFARIYPAYVFALVIAFPLFLHGIQFGHEPSNEWVASHLPLTVVLVLTLAQAWVPPAAIAWNGVSWSLSVETFCYVVFPLLLLAGNRMAKTGRSRMAAHALIVTSWAGILLAAGLSYLVFLGAGADLLSPRSWQMLWMHNPLIRSLEFFIGVATGLLFVSRRNDQGQSALWVMSALALCLTICLGWARSFYPPGVLAPTFALFIYGIALQPKWAHWLNHRVLVLLGDASYSLYLLHIPLLTYFTVFVLVPTGTPASIGIPVWTAGVLLVSVLVYLGVEQPARRLLRSKPA